MRACDRERNVIEEVRCSGRRAHPHATGTLLSWFSYVREMSRPLLKFSGGSVDILRDVLH
jgi:hypothetical protein